MAKYVKTEEGYQEIEAINSKFIPFKPAGKSYLTFSSLSSFTLKVNDATKHWDGTLEYFASDKTWTVWDGTTTISAIFNDGEYVLYLRGTGNTVITGKGENYRWVLTGSDIKCIGNIENLLDYATVESGNHPTMAPYCYAFMFCNCTSLTQAPTLPATTLANGCYQGMFEHCTGLTQAPTLPATMLANSCYFYMFCNCTSLTQAPTLPATTLASSCCQGMFKGCTSLTKAHALPATTLANSCYMAMFSGCTSLTQAPALPATTLANGCYYLMFYGCTSLTKAPELPAMTLADQCYSYMFQDCTSLTQAPALPATTLVNQCYSYMFIGCTSLTQAPALPATTLDNQCYSYMFIGCTSLKLSSSKTDEYTQEYRIPSSGEGATVTNALTNMFTSTGGTFAGTPSINTIYYLSSNNMVVCETEVATLNGYVDSMIDAAITEHTSNPLNITGATVGQIAKITAVDENGKPTAWEAVDMPSGGGSAVALDTTLTQSGKAADAKAVGDALAGKQPKGDYLTQDNLQDATNAALAQAKGSGAFDGTDGKTPVKGTDYWTASDKAEVVAEAAAAIDLTSYAKKTEVPTKTSQLTNDSGFFTSHQDISGKQDKATLEADVAAKGFTKNTGTYSKPAGGIPKADLAAAVQTSLGKADTALQEHQSLAAYRTAAAQDVIDSGKVAKVDGKGLSTNDYTDAAKAKVDAIPAVDSTLTVSGAAADAKETGTRLNTLSGELDNFIASGGFSAPIVDSVDEMVDTSKQYILKSTGTIWAYKETTAVGTVTENCDDGYTYLENSRLGSDGSVVTEGAYAGYTVTPFIDLLAYPVPFTLHLEGCNFIPNDGAGTSYTRIATYTAEQTKISAINTGVGYIDNIINVSDSDVTNDASGNGTIHFTKTPKTNNNNNDGVLRYVRFSGKTTTTPKVYVTYEATVTEATWVDTGIQYGSGGLDAETAAKISALNNEGNSPSIIKLLPKPVLDFYNASAYSDSDYSYSHLEKITYPCRADIPVPFTVKWEYNEEAMRTTVSVDTRAIGTVNAYTLRTYDATGLNKFPIYNLLPNKTYYYKVTHVLSDGSLVEAKSGSFTTSSETWRLLYIDGTQNVRDLGGWTGLNGKKVKYGKIIRGAALNDSSLTELLLTGKGRRSFGELAIQAELNLGATDNETSIAANCIYKKIGYTNYAIAITGETYRAQFKEVLEWIVEQLTASKPIYMHCQGGCDRTGTLSFQLLGLLGVSESDLAKEYEMSSFSNIGFGRLRTTTKAVDTYDYVGMVEALKAYSGTTVADKFYDFATTGCGISANTIANFRNLMLE